MVCLLEFISGKMRENGEAMAVGEMMNDRQELKSTFPL
jgi:hypothetical protein